MCTVSLRRDTLWVSLPVSWSRCFGLCPAWTIPISSLRRLENSVIIYLDDMLLMSLTLEELFMSRDTIIFLLTQLGFIINLKKSILVLVQQIEFLGFEIGFCRNESISSSKKGRGDCSDVSKNNRRQFDLKGFDKVTGEIDFYNSNNFSSKISDSFPAADGL